MELSGIDFYRAGQGDLASLMKIKSAGEESQSNMDLANEYADFREFLMDEELGYDEYKDVYRRFLKWKGYTQKEINEIFNPRY